MSDEFKKEEEQMREKMERKNYDSNNVLTAWEMNED